MLKISRLKKIDIMQIIVKLVAISIILAITIFFTMGITENSMNSMFITSIFLVILDYIIIRIFKDKIKFYGNALISAILAAIILYALNFIIGGYVISWIAAIFGGLTYGMLDYMILSDKK